MKAPLEIPGSRFARCLVSPAHEAGNRSLQQTTFAFSTSPRQNYITCEGAEWQRKRAPQNGLSRSAKTDFLCKFARLEQSGCFAEILDHATRTLHLIAGAAALVCIVHRKKSKGRELPEANA
jgi:hypothetical protein